MITYLSVPFEEHKEAKALGARYNMSLKLWYVPDGVDIYGFRKWNKNIPKLSKKIKKVLRRKVWECAQS